MVTVYVAPVHVAILYRMLCVVIIQDVMCGYSVCCSCTCSYIIQDVMCDYSVCCCMQAASIMRASIGNPASTLMEEEEVPLLPSLDFTKIKQDLLMLSDDGRVRLLQALRWVSWCLLVYFTGYHYRFTFLAASDKVVARRPERGCHCILHEK